MRRGNTPIHRNDASFSPATVSRAVVLAAVACVILSVGAAAADRPAKPMPSKSPELIESGRAIYFKRCSFCHGLLGDGNGPAAEFMDPRPRDFTLGTYKFRTTQSGELPLDQDLFRTVSRGLPGTGMQAFDNDVIKNGLYEDERWAVIAYIKTFAPEFADPNLDPVKSGKVVALPKNLAVAADTVAKGREVFEKAKCWECHGKVGRGDGQKAFDRKDDWGFPIRIRNVTHPWKIKAGTRAEDIFMRFSTGISGTPMPSFAKTLSEEDRWNLANYIGSLQYKAVEHQALTVRSLAGDLPTAPDDPQWATAASMDIRLTGQVVAPPRWQNPSVEMVTLRALFNDKEIAFLLEWDDPFMDVVHKKDKELDVKELRKIGGYNSYVAANGVVPRALETFRDAIALQFPVKSPEGTKKPHFLRGDPSNPVHLWLWQADAEAAGARAVEEAVSRGWSSAPKTQPEDQQQLIGKGMWKDGRWSVVMRRPLTTPDKNDVQFVPGAFIPVAVNAWDGSNGEHGLVMSLSTWRYVFLEARTPPRVYVYTVLAVILSGVIGMWLVRKASATNADKVKA